MGAHGETYIGIIVQAGLTVALFLRLRLETACGDDAGRPEGDVATNDGEAVRLGVFGVHYAPFISPS